MSFIPSSAHGGDHLIGYSVMTMSPLLLQKINQTQVTKLAA